MIVMNLSLSVSLSFLVMSPQKSGQMSLRSHVFVMVSLSLSLSDQMSQRSHVIFDMYVSSITLWQPIACHILQDQKWVSLSSKKTNKKMSRLTQLGAPAYSPAVSQLHHMSQVPLPPHCIFIFTISNIINAIFSTRSSTTWSNIVFNEMQYIHLCFRWVWLPECTRRPRDTKRRNIPWGGNLVYNMYSDRCQQKQFCY